MFILPFGRYCICIWSISYYEHCYCTKEASRTSLLISRILQVGPVEFFGRYSRRGVVFKPSIDRKRKDEDEDHDGDHSDEDGFHTVTTLHYKDRISQSFVPRLFRTSKTVYSEAATIYFRYNDFKFNGLDNVAPFINGLPAISRRAITSVSIEYTGIGPALAAKALNTCVGLQYLHLHFRESSTFLIPFKMGRRQDMKGWQALNGLTSFLKLRGLAELRVTKSKSNSFSWRFDDDWHAFVEALQVLKQPPNGRHLTIQGNKDFPKQAVREVFGNTNFVTRAERRFTGRKLYRIPLPGECPESERELFANS